MKYEEKSKNKIASWDSHLDKKYGGHGTATRTDFEVKAHTFILKFSSIRGGDNLRIES